SQVENLIAHLFMRGGLCGGLSEGFRCEREGQDGEGVSCVFEEEAEDTRVPRWVVPGPRPLTGGDADERTAFHIGEAQGVNPGKRLDRILRGWILQRPSPVHKDDLTDRHPGYQDQEPEQY